MVSEKTNKSKLNDLSIPSHTKNQIRNQKHSNQSSQINILEKSQKIKGARKQLLERYKFALKILAWSKKKTKSPTYDSRKYHGALSPQQGSGRGWGGGIKHRQIVTAPHLACSNRYWFANCTPRNIRCLIRTKQTSPTPFCF